MSGESWWALTLISGYLVITAASVVWAVRRLRDVGAYLRDIKNATTADERRRLRGLSAPTFWLVDRLGLDSLPPDTRSELHLRRFPTLNEYRAPEMSVRVLRLYETQLRYRSNLAKVLEVSSAALYGVMASVVVAQLLPMAWRWAHTVPDVSSRVGVVVVEMLASLSLPILVVALLGAPFVTYAWFAQQRHVIARHQQSVANALARKVSDQKFNS